MLNKEEIISSLNPKKYIGRSVEQVEEFIKGTVMPVLERYDLTNVSSEVKL